MYPAVPPPKSLRARHVDFRLKPGWRYDEVKRVFASDDGLRFAPPPLPKRSRIVYKVPVLAKASARGLSKHELELALYMQLLLPPAAVPDRYVQMVLTWPCVDYAQMTPEVSLPAGGEPLRAGGRGRGRTR